ncbi:MAG: protein-disulfide reductase DsbD [Pseudomonadales bacterium]|nr:protein-disulfide reductase DsbD [Pseudomonadales bacterium]
MNFSSSLSNTLPAIFFRNIVLMTFVICTSLYTSLVFASGPDPLTQSSTADDFFNSANDQFLPVDQAFRPVLLETNTDQQPHKISTQWQITEGYYLYRDRFKFSVEPTQQVSINKIELPDGQLKNDEYFGETEVYHDSIVTTLLLNNTTNQPYKIKVVFQGCADAGLCYPPTTRYFEIGQTGESSGSDTPLPSTVDNDSLQNQPQPTEAVAENPDNENQLLALLNQATLAKIIVLFFLAGIGLTFTPCVLPMIPILSSVVIGQDKTPSRSRAFLLSGSYVLGMALAFTVAGALMGYFGAQLNLQARLQSPLLLSIFALFFVGLSLSMFGYYELRLPSGLQNRVDALSRKQEGGTLIGASVMGVLSALVVSPCVSAPLAAALVYISTTGDATIGALALLMLGLGMGAPLIVIATLGSHLLPKSGGWMDDVKTFFGILLLGVAIWLLERILPGQLTLILWALLLAGTASFLQITNETSSRLSVVFRKSAALIMAIYCSILIVGATLGGGNPLNPLEPLQSGARSANTTSHSELTFYPADNSAQLEKLVDQAKQQGKPLMIDFYADWCISCKVMENQVFTDPQVSSALQKFLLVRADITDNTAIHQQLLNRFKLFGPPALVFFDSTGVEVPEFRTIGEVDVKSLLNQLQIALNHEKTLNNR